MLAVGAGGGCMDLFTLIYPLFPLSLSLWETARYRLKYCLKGPLNPKPTNQPTKTRCHHMLKDEAKWKVITLSSSGVMTEHNSGWSGSAMALENFQCRGVLQFG